MDVNLWIVTGNSGSGKTAFCQEMSRVARIAGWDTAGLISPALFKDGIKDSIWAEEIRSGEKHMLASAQPQTEQDLVFGDWFFNRETLEWGNHVLLASIPCDLLMIDELGPLEFNLSLGWVSAMDVIKSAKFRLAIVLIRPELLKTAQSIFYPTQIVSINHMNQVHGKLTKFLPLLPKLLDFTKPFTK